MLFEAIKKELAREGIKHESTLLRECLASLTHYIESFKYESKVELKREASDKVERLVVYLDGMAYKDPDVYGKEYGFVAGIITNINNTYKTKAKRRLEPYEEEYDGGLDETQGEESDTPEYPDAPEPPEAPEPPDDPAASATPECE